MEIRTQNDIVTLKEKDEGVILTKAKSKKLYNRIIGYNDDYMCTECAPDDVMGNELW